MLPCRRAYLNSTKERKRRLHNECCQTECPSIPPCHANLPTKPVSNYSERFSIRLTPNALKTCVVLLVETFHVSDTTPAHLPYPLSLSLILNPLIAGSQGFPSHSLRPNSA